jgi:hypothetical protein
MKLSNKQFQPSATLRSRRLANSKHVLDLARCLMFFAALLAPSLSTHSANITGNLLDIMGVSYNPRVTFEPRSTPIATNQSTVLDVPRGVTPTNGQFTVSLVGGRYDVHFDTPNKPIPIFVPLNDTNTYTFNDVARLAANAAMFTGTNITIVTSNTVARTGDRMTGPLTNSSGFYPNSGSGQQNLFGPYTGPGQPGFSWYFTNYTSANNMSDAMDLTTNGLSLNYGKFIGDGSTLTNVPGIGDLHYLYVSPTSTATFSARGDPTHPAGLFWSFTGGPPSGICAQATNGDTIVVMPGKYLATAIPLNQGVKMIGQGNVFIQRTNFFISGTNAGYFVARPMIYVNDNTAIEGITFQCGTNQYDTVIGANWNTEDNGPFVIQGTNVQTANVNDLHQLYVWPEYGFTNLQAAATNCVIRNCTLKGGTDAIYGSGDRTLTLVFSNAVYGAGAGYELLVTSNMPQTDIQFENCAFLSQWDCIFGKGSALTFRTRSCNFRTSSDVPGSVAGVGSASSARIIFLLNGACWIDNGSQLYLAAGTNIQTVIQSTFPVYLNGTLIYATNAVLAGGIGTLKNLVGTYVDVLNNSTNTGVYSNNVSAATSITMNTDAGKVRLASGNKVYTVNNSLITSQSAIGAMLQTASVGATLTNAVPGASTITLQMSGNTTADADIAWWIIHR